VIVPTARAALTALTASATKIASYVKAAGLVTDPLRGQEALTSIQEELDTMARTLTGLKGKEIFASTVDVKGLAKRAGLGRLSLAKSAALSFDDWLKTKKYAKAIVTDAQQGVVLDGWLYKNLGKGAVPAIGKRTSGGVATGFLATPDQGTGKGEKEFKTQAEAEKYLYDYMTK
jgi:hypothetical protein